MHKVVHDAKKSLGAYLVHDVHSRSYLELRRIGANRSPCSVVEDLQNASTDTVSVENTTISQTN